MLSGVPSPRSFAMQNTPSQLPAAITGCCGSKGAFEILSDCHKHILERLALLDVVGQDLQRTPEFDEHRLAVLCDVLTFIDTAVPMHSADEEETLFPRLRKAMDAPAGSHTPMDCMEEEHVAHRNLLAGLKRAVMQRDAAAAGRLARSIVMEYRSHIGREEEILYPWARETLCQDELLVRMAEEMHARRRAAQLSGC